MICKSPPGMHEELERGNAGNFFHKLVQKKIHHLLLQLQVFVHMASEQVTNLVQTWRAIIIGKKKSWVLFEHGTCVIFATPKPEDDLSASAVTLLREFGPVVAATSAGDFSVVTLDAVPGWVVTGHHPDVLTYVAPSEVQQPHRDVAIGMFGRGKRHRDGTELRIVHIEDKRQD